MAFDEPPAPHVMRQRALALCFFACRRRQFHPTTAFAPTAEARVNTPTQRTALRTIPAPPPVSSPPPPFFYLPPPPIPPTAHRRCGRPSACQYPYTARRVTHNSSAPRWFRTRRHRFFARRRRRPRPTAAFARTTDARVNTPTQRTVLHTIPAPPRRFFARRRRRYCPTAAFAPTAGCPATATGFGPTAAAAFCPPPPPLSPPRGVHAHWRCGRPSTCYTQRTCGVSMYLKINYALISYASGASGGGAWRHCQSNY
ncbi:hypothetical protein B0H11DRAFT_1952121 [Mycena galericulata]|nr:hypothetical protein B0H11DRAFT_1952121 [Mycena galericulata]